jgi:hypothetical protein
MTSAKSEMMAKKNQNDNPHIAFKPAQRAKVAVAGPEHARCDDYRHPLHRVEGPLSKRRVLFLLNFDNSHAVV